MNAVFDVAVIGAGPAGSTAAALLARQGRRVVVFDKDRHPRFHIGESLLPLNLELFETLGVAEEVARIGLVKPEVEFHSAEHGRAQSFSFADALDTRFPHAYEVRRSEFDAVLLANARRCGATVHEGTRVVDVTVGADRVRLGVRHDDGREGEFEAAEVIDASGRDALMAGRMGSKRKHPRHASAALYGHFEGVRRYAGAREGTISIYWFEHGWFWLIPLKGGTTSVGAVCWPRYLKTRRTDPTRFLLDTIALCPALADRMTAARPVGPVTATGNYSYLGTTMTAPRLTLVGDAYAFIDPVFSSGVYLGMKSGALAAEMIDGILARPQDAPRLRARFERTVRRGLARFSWMIFRMTNPAMRDLIMAPRNEMRLRDGVVSLLAGDVYGWDRVAARVLLFRAVYYVAVATRPLRSWRAWRRRLVNVRPEPIHATDGSG
jgi:flavin-dependent dehydrogenase